VSETFLDEIARKGAIDPVQFRLDLLKNAPRARRVVETVATMAGWGRKRDGRGLGFAFIEFTGGLTAGIAEVSVDRRRGQIMVHEFWCAADCGLQVQPDNIVAQIEGGIVYGLGLATSERITIKDGIVEQSNFHDYLVPRMNEVPIMHVELLATDNHPVGVGQLSTPLVAPAIGNAVAHLTGVRLREIPMSPDRLKKALG
jgi:isoquinoline 1-oxidoreductase beta subunit